VPALRYRAKPMTKGFTTEGGRRFAFPPYVLRAWDRGSGDVAVAPLTPGLSPRRGGGSVLEPLAFDNRELSP